ncbi:Probable S-adenosylmethionine-dependent methyltransferase MSMEG_2350 [Yersinia intermedia]|uniref:Probable S-adenosylmethionine-dependent methyltransferase MSMEG_2350 n=1 Tax=Yersinia intermedia TaxID=631 RepID=A0A0H5LQD5_YERIN|nr:class I SAM-dependent methyltransferase [Yersinia intermedia]CRY53284.1 Probable S-adenosylmethionine-dependent methyltransferase MSMEG_2350 [Yersinia intermedia]
MADFYRAFEDRYRGSQASIKDRLMVYSPLIERIKELHGGLTSLDLGCGRGEWMSLLRDLGVETFGIDLDDAMLEECRIRNFSVSNVDAISFLNSCEAEKYHIITAFHFVEHIAFDDLCTVIDNAIRVLKPGGILILETPNAENIIVGTNNFYLDPTHKKPIPALLLNFLCEYYGLENSYIMRLQHPQGLLDKTNFGLYDVITGVSFDYSVIAQKKDINAIEVNIEEILGGKSGYNLEKLSRLYDKKTAAKFEESKENYNLLEEKINLLENNLQDVQLEFKRLTEERTKELTIFKRLIEERTKELAMFENRIELIYKSNSWKFTAPFRSISSKIKKKSAKKISNSANINLISIKENKYAVKAYSLLKKLSPSSAGFLKLKYDEVIFNTEVNNFNKKAQEKLSIASENKTADNLNELNHFDLVTEVNHINMMSTDSYINYLQDVIKSDGFQHLNSSLPAGTDTWILKIKEAFYLNKPLEDLFPTNIENIAAATALYIVLLKRLPENDMVRSKPIRHLCMVIQQSEEYKKASGNNLKNWCDL